MLNIWDLWTPERGKLCKFHLLSRCEIKLFHPVPKDGKVTNGILKARLSVLECTLSPSLTFHGKHEEFTHYRALMKIMLSPCEEKVGRPEVLEKLPHWAFAFFAGTDDIQDDDDTAYGGIGTAAVWTGEDHMIEFSSTVKCLSPSQFSFYCSSLSGKISYSSLN